MLGKLPLGLFDEDLTWIIESKSSIDKLDFIAADFDGFEEGGRRRCCPCDLPDFAIFKGSRRIIRLEESRQGLDIIFCNC